MQEFPILLHENNITGERNVSARDLWEFLEVRYDFSTWIKRRIEKYDFVENVDFTMVSLIPQNCGIKRGGDRKSFDYILTLDMAKELCMIENNAKGREARRYFIACEKELFSIMKNRILAIETSNNFPKWDLLKGSVKCVTTLSKDLTEEIRTIERSLKRIDSFKIHMYLYSKQATDLLEELKEKIALTNK